MIRDIIQEDGITSYAYGHFRIAEQQQDPVSDYINMM